MALEIIIVNLKDSIHFYRRPEDETFTSGAIIIKVLTSALSADHGLTTLTVNDTYKYLNASTNTLEVGVGLVDILTSLRDALIPSVSNLLIHAQPGDRLSIPDNSSNKLMVTQTLTIEHVLPEGLENHVDAKEIRFLQYDSKLFLGEKTEDVTLRATSETKLAEFILNLSEVAKKKLSTFHLIIDDNSIPSMDDVLAADFNKISGFFRNQVKKVMLTAKDRSTIADKIYPVLAHFLLLSECEFEREYRSSETQPGTPGAVPPARTRGSKGVSQKSKFLNVLKSHHENERSDKAFLVKMFKYILDNDIMVPSTKKIKKKV